MLPGHIVGRVTIDGIEDQVDGLLAPDGTLQLTISERSASSLSPARTGFAHVAGQLTLYGSEASGGGVVLGEGCGDPAPNRFCGVGRVATLELSKTGQWNDEGSDGVLRVTTGAVEETWPVHFGYWGGVASFDSSFVPTAPARLYVIQGADFVRDGDVMLSIDDEGRWFFQSAAAGCTGNGAMVERPDAPGLYAVELTIGSCQAPYQYLNASFSGLATFEASTPWDYGDELVKTWLAAPAPATPSAITFWATPAY